MPLEPYDWNVVVLGHWNRAILTPQGIASRLFQVPSETEIGIEVPMDAIGPFRVSHRDLTVIVEGGRLMVEARENNFPSLERAMRVARRGMESLPETPVMAAGLNIRAQGAGEDEHLGPLIKATQLRWDREFEGAGYPIFRRDVTWVADWQAGKISVNLSREDQDRVLRVNANFERAGNRDELMTWLARPVEEVEDQVRRIFFGVFALQTEAVQWLRR
ncbi:MAG: hypothetical protein K2R98_05895 [Gemmataceae bacterium]|nr:hypothetical protein [Gemmataceae bacterium]